MVGLPDWRSRRGSKRNDEVAPRDTMSGVSLSVRHAHLLRLKDLQRTVEAPLTLPI